MKGMIFAAIVVSLLVAGGCARDRHTVITVYAEADAYERSPFHESGASARIAYRMDVEPVRTR